MSPRRVNFGFCRFKNCNRPTLRVKRNDRNSTAYNKYCTMHHQRIAKGLDPEKTPLLRSGAMNRINVRSIKKQNGCIEYKYSLDRFGYGRVCDNGFQKRASRFIWEHHNGPIPNKLLVCHKCDNPSCVNIDHLFLGTHKDNAADMIKKNRCPVGEKRPCSKLKEKDVLEIFTSNLKTKLLSKKFKVTISTIYAIKHKKYWKKTTETLKEVK